MTGQSNLGRSNLIEKQSLTAKKELAKTSEVQYGIEAIQHLSRSENNTQVYLNDHLWRN